MGSDEGLTTTTLTLIMSLPGRRTNRITAVKEFVTVIKVCAISMKSEEAPGWVDFNTRRISPGTSSEPSRPTLTP